MVHPDAQELLAQRRTARCRLVWSGLASIILLPLVFDDFGIASIKPPHALMASLLIIGFSHRCWQGILDLIRIELSAFPPTIQTLGMALPSLIVVLSIAAVTPGAGFIWGILGATVCWSLRVIESGPLPRCESIPEAHDGRSSPQSSAVLDSGSQPAQPEIEVESSQSSSDEFYVHRFERGQTPELGEFAQGQIRVELAAGSSQQNTHITFCPAFPGLPEVSCESTDSEGITIRIAEIYRHGFRMDVRRSKTSSDVPQSVEIEYLAFCTEQQRAA